MDPSSGVIRVIRGTVYLSNDGQLTACHSDHEIFSQLALLADEKIESGILSPELGAALSRAPGVSNVKGSSTAVNLSEELRDDSKKGFQQATENMITNLDTQLNRFKDKNKGKP